MYTVWSPQLGAEERHVPDAAALMPNPRVTHYWDPGMLIGRAYQGVAGLSWPAWDFWMLFDREASWIADETPEPAWWEHQLRGLPPERRLDADRFAGKARLLLEERVPAEAR